MKKNIIKSHEYAFHEYLVNRFPDFTNEIINVLLEEKNDVFLFSGIIRDYFLHRDKKLDFDVRDLDIVVLDINKFKKTIENKIKHKKNSFGGLKLYFNEITIDVWQTNLTWGLNTITKINNNNNIINILPETVFFNCSSILFDFQSKTFIEDNNNHFQSFIESKILDIVLEENPLPELCILNTIHYTNKYNLKVSEKLAYYVTSTFPKINKNRLMQIQKNHFNKIIYEINQLQREVEKLITKKNNQLLK
ncbi:hypothetical protein [Morganella morganii]|uniref:hypothetical protein n=1 Tax=Morganella morganii TaxID=582 RepID=UPI001419EF46|nr:hypothetical protein [Morganella morganii]NIH20291.1 hypothetical protein [Morganella morganii]